MSALTPALAAEIIEKQGPAFYLLDSSKFISNFNRFKEYFSQHYPHFGLAYSYKTNYTPKLCRLVNEMGGYAEVVSVMELELAHKIGVPDNRIIWNGPIKPPEILENFLLNGGQANIDNLAEAQTVAALVAKYPNRDFRLGIRCNFDIGDKNISRFGIDTAGNDFPAVLDLLTESSRRPLFGLHCHFSPRNFKTWQARVSGMLGVLKQYGIKPARLDFGGSLFGEMAPETAAQYKADIPSWEDYAKAITVPLKKYLTGMDESLWPELVLEPGSALVSNCMNFCAKVLNIKQIHNKNIATAYGSSYNLTQSLSRKNPPLSVVAMGQTPAPYHDLDIGGFTCIDFDYLARHVDITIAPGDILVFHDCGAYSVVLRPPFILPNFPILEINGNGIEVIKRRETGADVFGSYEL